MNKESTAQFKAVYQGEISVTINDTMSNARVGGIFI